VMNGDGESGRRQEQRRPRTSQREPEDRQADDDRTFVSPELQVFEKWA